MKKVVIDARLSGLKHAGIGRYIQSLLKGLEVQSSKFKVQSLEIKTIAPSIQHYSLAEQIQMPGVLEKEHPDLVHFPHFNVPLLYRKPFVVTIHDLLWHDQVGMDVTTLPVWLYGIKYLGYRLVMNHAISDAKAIIVPSHWVEKKVLERFPNAAGRIHVIYEGVSEVFKDASLKVRPLEYLMYTGSLYPHKNVDLVLRVLKHFPNLKLVVACSRNVFWEKFRDKIKHMGLEKKVVLAGFIPDEELVTFYQSALAFVFPSLSEGFGLPGLEAMAVGCPVISSNEGALPEIYGDSAAYFDPKSEGELRTMIEKVKENNKFRDELIKKGKERAKQFSWEKCTEETLAVYESCLRLRSGQ